MSSVGREFAYNFWNSPIGNHSILRKWKSSFKLWISRGLFWFGHGFINSWPRIHCCVLFKRNWFFEQKSPWHFVEQKISDLVSSCIVIEEFDLFKHVKNLLDEMWKLVNLVSYLSQQRGSPWLDAFRTFHDNSCLLKLLGDIVSSHRVGNTVT